MATTVAKSPTAPTNGSSARESTAAALNAEADRIFRLQEAHQQTVANTTARERKQKLKRLHEAVLRHRQDFRDALHADFRKHPSEVDLTEIYPVTGEIKHAIKHLSKWMRPERVSTPIALLGSRSYIHREPKGVVLIISPWNFPVNLTFGPLVSAVAAGNCVTIKPSEHTPHTSSLIKKVVGEVFDEREVAVLEGAVEAAQAVLRLPFNHIFFTGAPAIGKIVMEAAAKHLGSVTLELGGKCPTIVDESASVDAAARRLAWSKYLNNGQICIAPDYVFVHESKKDALIAKIEENVRKFYGEAVQQSDSYARVVNNHHYHRVKSYLDDARERGANVVVGGQVDGAEDFISPTLMTDVPYDSKLMTDEIFGPVLPVHGYTDIEEPLRVINGKEKPLALYVYSKNQRNIDHIINNTRAGGTCINHSAVHFFNNNLPFGGVNNSGIGKGHGFAGFDAFSNGRGVYKQVLPFSAIELMTAPYNSFKQKLIDLSIKFF